MYSTIEASDRLCQVAVREPVAELLAAHAGAIIDVSGGIPMRP